VSDSNVRILTKTEYPLWDELITKSPQGTIFHTSSWITKNAELSKKKERIYGYFINENLVAGCPIYSAKKYHFLNTGISNLPMTPYGGFVLSSPQNSIRKLEQTQNMIISELTTELIKDFNYIKIINSPNFFDIRQFIWTGWKSSIYYAYFLSLNENFEKKFSRNIIRFIQKAKKLGIRVEKEYNPDLYYELYKKTYDRKSLESPFSKNMLIEMMDMIISKNIGEMWIAKTPNGEMAAADLVIWDTHFAHRWSAVSDAQFNETGAVSLLLNEVFQDLKYRGFHEINLFSANTPHLTNFITAFNPTLKPYYGIEINRLKVHKSK